MEFTTIVDVELCSVGMNWPSAGGEVTLTMEHVADAAATWEDPHIVPARLKIGHVDPRFEDPDDPGHDPFYDGEPALGSIHNLRLTNDGATLVGDYVNVPTWLAEVLPSAYPSRSIEGAYSIAEGSGGKLIPSWDVVTPANRKYSFCITACSLLGLSRPAVQDLEDLRFLLTEGGGVIVTGDPEAGGVPIAVSMGAVPDGAVSLETDVDAVIDTFYSEFCVDDRYWWWARAVRVDPNVIIADDDEGSLWSVGINTDGDQNITFDEPKRVLQTFTPAPEAAAVLSAAAQTGPREGRTIKAFAARKQSAPADRKSPLAAAEVAKSDSCPADMPWAVIDGDQVMSCHASKEQAESAMGPMMRAKKGGGSTSANNSGMDFSDTQRAALCKRLDLSEDATDEQVAAALEAVPETSPAEPETPETPEAPETPEETPEQPEEETPAEETPEETTTPVDSTVLSQLQADAAAGRAARDQQVAAHRESVLKAALKDGKITPASKSAWETKLKGAPEATEAELAALPTGLVPVEEIGHGGSSTNEAAIVSEAEMAAMFPGHATRKAAA